MGNELLGFIFKGSMYYDYFIDVMRGQHQQNLIQSLYLVFSLTYELDSDDATRQHYSQRDP
jgi:hypothetical protein